MRWIVGTAEYQVAPCVGALGPERARREAARRDHAAARGQRRRASRPRARGRGRAASRSGSRRRRRARRSRRRRAPRRPGCAAGSARPWACWSCRSCAGAARSPRGRAPAATPVAVAPASASSAVRSPVELELTDAERLAGRARRTRLAAQEEHRARLQVFEIGAELVRRVGLVERRGRGAGGHDGEECGHDLGAVRQAQRDRVARLDARRDERARRGGRRLARSSP